MKFDINKILEYYNNLNDQARYYILAGVVFLIILLDVILLVLPQMGSIAKVNDRIKKLSEDTQQVLVDKARINLLRKNLQEARMQLKFLSGKVRSIQEVPSILSAISSTANEYGVKIDQLIPNKSKMEALMTAADGKYYSLPVEIKTHCGYHKFGYFLNRLENQDMFFVMKDFIIQNEGKDPHTHLFSLTINLILVEQAVTKSKNL